MRPRVALLIALFVAGISVTGTFAHAETTTTSAAPATPLIFQMANGSFFNPASGLSAPTRDQLIALLNGAPTTTLPVVSSTVAVSSTPALPPTDHEPVFPLKTAIEQAQAHFRAEIATSSPAIVKTDDGWRDIEIAVWHPDTDTVTYHQIAKKGTKIKAPAGLTIRARSSNYLNTDYVVDDGKDVVVATLYPFYSDVKVNGHKRYKITPVVYTPYSSSLDTPSLAAFGRTLMDKYVKDGFAALRSSEAHSRAFPAKDIADVVDPNLVKSIAVIEHSDQRTLASNPSAAASVFFVTLGANRDHAYAYSQSTVGATGIVQFMPSTYKLLAKRPELGLIQDVARGTGDPGNAIKAEAAYLDALLAAMPEQVRSAASTSQAIADEYLAAAYNTGEGRVRKAIAAWGDDWSKASKEALAALKKQKPVVKKEVATLTTKIKAQKDLATISDLKIQLTSAKAQLASIEAKIAAGKGAVLTNETLDYLQKFRHAFAYLTTSGGGSSVAVLPETLN